MQTVYIREMEKYSFNDILSRFKIKKECEATKILEKLKSYGIIKTLKNKSDNIDLDDLNTEEVEFLDEDLDKYRKKYIFKYVGIITTIKYVIICYPKYIEIEKNLEKKMKQVLKVIKKYDSDEQIVKLYSETMEEKKYNYLGVIINLINEYYGNGIYLKDEQIIEVNGGGEILWDKTINETYAYMLNNRPYYLELYTTNSRSNDEDYFTGLHQAILTECSQKLKSLELIEILDFEEIELTEKCVEEFGEKEYILYRLEKELNEQYITKKQNILRGMYAYVENTKFRVDGVGVCFYGTNSFNLVWEKVCSDVLDNKINVKLKNLPLNGFEECREKTLKEIIEKPIWKIYDDGNERKAKETLIPDLISIFRMNDNHMFAIFDAKYYDIKYNKDKIWNQPGVGDVNKQYLYQLAYQEFINKSGYNFIVNAFLIPTAEKTTSVGQVKMNILSKVGINKLKNIEVINLNAEEMYEAYINNKNINIQDILKFIICDKYENKIDNNIGAKIILKAIEKINIEEFNNKDIEEMKNFIHENSFIKEVNSDYLIKNSLDRVALKFDKLFKLKNNLSKEEIEKEINHLSQETGQVLNQKITDKLNQIYLEYYSVIYWSERL